MKKLLVLLVACLFLSAVPISSVTCPVAMGQDDLGQPIEMQFNIDGPEFDMDAQRVDPAAAAAAAGMGLFGFLIWLTVIVISIASLWKIFTKAGKPGWAAIIPIYNFIVLLEIIGRPIWWIILLFIPCVNIVVSVIVFIDLAKSFGKDALFGIGLWLLGIIFLPILAFGSAEYQGPAAAQ